MSGYECRLCSVVFLSKEHLIDTFSEEGREKAVEDKVLLFTCNLMFEHDGLTNFVCRMCYTRIDLLSKLLMKFRLNNSKILHRIKSVPGNLLYVKQREAFRRFSVAEVFSNSTTLKGKCDRLKKKLDAKFQADAKQDKSANRPTNNGSGAKKLVRKKKKVTNNNIRTPTSSLASRNIPVTITSNVEQQDNGVEIIVINDFDSENDMANNENGVADNENGVVKNENDVADNENDVADNETPQSSSAHTNNRHVVVEPNIEPKINITNDQSTNNFNINPLNDHDYSSSSSQYQSISNGTLIDPNDLVQSEDDDDDVLFVSSTPAQTNLNRPIMLTKSIPKQTKPISKPLNIDSNIDTKVVNTYNVIIKNPSENVLLFKRKLIPIDISNDSSNVLSEEMTITPDIILPCNDEAVESDNNQSQNSNVVISGSSLITPETGFHFLYSSEQIIDLTNEPELNEETVAMNKKRKNNKDHFTDFAVPYPKRSPPVVYYSEMASKTPKKVTKVSSTTTKRSSSTNKASSATAKVSSAASKVSLAASKVASAASKVASAAIKTEKQNKPSPYSRRIQRPKRAAAANNGNSNLGKLKLEHQSNINGWVVKMNRISLHLYTCPICKKMFCTPESRLNHEKSHHMPKYTKDKLTSFLSTSDVTVSDLSITAEQQEFLINLNLVKVSPDKQNAVDRLAHRKHLVDALKIFGNSTGVYNCHHCAYKTCRMFILWAHMSSVHTVLDTDKKCNLYCIKCDRVLNKRTKFLKHLDNCLGGYRLINGLPDFDKLSCHLCNKQFTSLSLFETHLFDHAANHKN